LDPESREHPELSPRAAWPRSTTSEEFAKCFPRYTIDETRCRRVHMSNVHGFASVPFARA